MTGEERHAESINGWTKIRDRGNISLETYNRLVLKSIELNLKAAAMPMPKHLPGSITQGDGGMGASGIAAMAFAKRFVPAAIGVGALVGVIQASKADFSFRPMLSRHKQRLKF